MRLHKPAMGPTIQNRMFLRFVVTQISDSEIFGNICIPQRKVLKVLAGLHFIPKASG